MTRTRARDETPVPDRTALIHELDALFCRVSSGDCTRKRPLRDSRYWNPVRSGDWDFAIQVAVVIVTRDEDFSQRKVLENGGPRAIWLRLSNPRRREVLALFGKNPDHASLV